MSKTAILAVKILGDAKGATDALDKTESRLGKFGKVAGGVALAGVAAVGTAVVGLGVAGGKAASELEQSVGAIDVVFKDSAKQMHAWADGAAQDVGLTKDEFNQLGTLIGTQLKNGGTAMDELAPKTNELVGLGADLASMFGGDTATAVEALSSALKGERDPIEKYGVSLTQAAIDAKAAELGFSKVGGALSAEANQAATLALIMDQTADAHGNFAKEASTVAGQQQRMTASAKNLVAELGTALLPIMLTVFTFLNDTAVPAVGRLVTAFTQAAGGGGLAAKLGLDQLGPILTTVGTSIMALVPTVLAIATQIGTALQPTLAAIGAAFSAIIPLVVQFVTGTLVPGAQAIAAQVMPVLTTIGSVVLPALIGALAAVVPHVVNVATNVVALGVAVASRVMPIIQALLPVVVTVFGAVQAVVSSALSVVSGIVRTVTAVISGDWSGAWDGIKSTARAALNLVKTIVTGALNILRSLWTAGLNKIGTAVRTGITKIVQFFRDLPGKIKSGLGNLGSLLTSAGSDLIRGFLGGIGSMAKAAANKAKEVAQGAVNAVKGLLGIRSPSKVFRELGKFTGQGLVIGLEQSQRDVARAAGDLLETPDKLARRMSPLDVNTPSGRRAGGSTPVVINITGALDPVAVGRQIRDLLDGYEALVRPA